MVEVKAGGDPARPDPEYVSLLPRWALVRTLMGGTLAMRAAGEAYLPRYEAEDLEAYRARLERAVLFPAFEETVRDITGRVFARPLVLGADVPLVLRRWLDDADLLGNSVHTVAQRWFAEALTTGIAWLQVDMPGPEVPAARRRPYLVVVPAEEVIAAQAGVVEGRWCLAHARVRYEVGERDGFFLRPRARVQVLEPGYWEIWQHDGPSWAPLRQGRTGLDTVPLVPLRLGPAVGALQARPPLEGLAHLNVAHWQSASDQRNILTLGRFAMLALSGPAPEGPDGGALAVGPKTFLHTPDAQARWYYVEPQGTALQAGERDLSRLEAQMDKLAMEPLLSRTGATTATATAIAESRANSSIKAWALQLRDGLEQALVLMAAWAGLGAGGSIDVNTDFTDAGDEADLDALAQARAAGDLSREAYLTELRRRGVLSWAFDPTADAQRRDSQEDSHP
ncbi:DUF4055 domain-containing protein [Pararhodospirillum photometricum]|uniref:DUF4055 domain-containing protein n=1 Tax=Pararhodospirillum photometricum DSM 122 TaxID=1150469 RepID=H6SRX8_PARPM|nr:DUF4055 domain-containing protein [Pararhodospirillum photometricum]CCG07657.1 Putative uncharacterized protein [Pararhodospirillum photometricum DSM 122]